MAEDATHEHKNYQGLYHSGQRMFMLVQKRKNQRETIGEMTSKKIAAVSIQTISSPRLMGSDVRKRSKDRTITPVCLQ